jgi:hypothetical protein
MVFQMLGSGGLQTNADLRIVGIAGREAIISGGPKNECFPVLTTAASKEVSVWVYEVGSSNDLQAVHTSSLHGVV